MNRLAPMLLLVAAACEGTLSLSGGEGAGGGLGAGGGVGTGGGTAFIPPSPAALFRDEAFGATPLQRLTARQYVREVERIFGVASGSLAELAPVDSPSRTSFDNDADGLSFSLQAIEDYEVFARAYAALVRSQQTPQVLAGCTPTVANDAVCFAQLVRRLGRLVYRRTLSSTEVSRHVSAFLPFAVEDNDFGTAVELLISAWLQHPEFLYRIEHGEVAPGRTVALEQHEVASRLAFIVTGQGPDAELLDAAEQGVLETPAGRLEQARRLIVSPEAVAERRTFHSRWLGYAERFLNPTLEQEAKAETAALVDRITGDGSRDWLNLLTADETFVTPALARHYALPPPSGASGWVRYPAGRGGGVLSHLTVAVLGSKFGDTSPTLRGYELFKRLTCGKLQGEIPPGLDTSLQPGAPSDCKPKRYIMRDTPGCQSCHAVTDNIGFGLENLGAEGQWREVETTNPSCAVRGEGTYRGEAFTGPAALGARLAEDPSVAQCATQRLFESTMGRGTRPEDAATLEALAGQYFEQRSYQSLVLALVQSNSILYKGAP